MVWRPNHDDVESYRNRAHELRAKADWFTPENRAMILKMANFYESFAQEAELEVLRAWRQMSY
jgi:hypothetical protein